MSLEFWSILESYVNQYNNLVEWHTASQTRDKVFLTPQPMNKFLPHSSDAYFSPAWQLPRAPFF